MSVNAPVAGTVKEFLVNEEDTVTVGQDLLKLETGEEGKGTVQTGGQAPKSPADENQPTSSDPEPLKDHDGIGHKEKSQSKTPEPENPSPAAPSSYNQKHTSPTDKNSPERSSVDVNELKSPTSKSTGVDSASGNREERRVFRPKVACS